MVSTIMVTEPTGTSLQRLTELAWDRTGRDSRLIFEDQVWTGEQLAARTRRLAGGLRGAGLAPGDRVAVCMANCPEVGVTYQAVWRAGAVPTPVIFLVSEDELRHVLADSGARFAVTTGEFLPKVLAAARGLADLRAVILVGGGLGDAGGTPVLAFADLESAADGPLVDRDPTELAALLYTGGTTGRAKGVALSHDAVSAAAWAATSSTQDEFRDTSLMPLPLSHVYGLMVSVMGLHVPDGRASILMRWFDPAGWVRLAAEHRASVSPLVPSMLRLILGQPLEDHDLSALRRLSSGAAPLPRDIVDEFARRLPTVEIAEGYGCTETGGLISTSPLGASRVGSVGRPAPGIEVRVERPDGSTAATGEDGEICVRGANCMTAYWHAPDETARALRGGWMHTGDVGRFDADGYLYVVDRLKDLIIRGGFNVYPRDVEDAMCAHPDVLACVVVGRPDPKYGEEVVAFVQVRPGAEVAAQDLVGYAKEHLSAAKYPRDVRVIDQLPLTAVGKADRKALRKLVNP